MSLYVCFNETTLSSEACITVIIIYLFKRQIINTKEHQKIYAPHKVVIIQFLFGLWCCPGAQTQTGGFPEGPLSDSST